MALMEKLPKEVYVHILRFLDVKDIIRCSRINHYWYDITNTDWVWKRFCNDGEYLIEYQAARDKQCTLEPCCYWKWYYVNNERIKLHWIRNKYKKYEILLNASDSNYKMATYDGNTLVICYTSSVRVMKVAEGKVHQLQRFFLPEGMLVLLNSVITNSLYIIFNCGKFVAVYKLDCDLYKGACLFFKKPARNLAYTSLKEEVFSELIVKSFFFGNISSIGSVIQENTLYIYVDKKIYIWDLVKMECQSEIEAVSFLVAQDKMNTYICFDHHTIKAYNGNSQSFLSVNISWKISRIETNQDILFATEEDGSMWDEASSRKVCAWHKFSGTKLYEISLPIPDFCFLHPRWNILLGNVSSGDNVCAISTKNNSFLWVRLTRRQDDPFADRILATGFRNLAADMFIITMIHSGTNYDMIDSKSGKSLYTFENTEIKYVGFDILLHTDAFRKNLIVRVYS